MFTSTCFAVFFVFFITGASQACKVGDDYTSENIVNNVGGKWYLNVALEATCSGSINRYKVKFYDDNLVNGRTYDSTLAVWRPINATAYEIDSSTIQQYSYEHDDKRRRKRGVYTRSTPTFSPAVGVRKGSVIGVYLDNTNPLEVIGNKPGETDINGKPIGACVTTTSSSTTILTCTGSNQPSYVIHAEADINKVTCNTPPTVSNAVYSQLDGDIQYGGRVQYNCSTGYNINGNDIISCQLDASWSSPTPSCSIVNCGNPGEPANGYTNDNVFTYQSTVQYYCNVGYQLSGDSSIECTAIGNWNNTLPNCAIINCTDPGTPTNGERTGVNFYYNSTVFYSCNTGYNLTGATSITCNATGLWSAPVPSCPPVNCGDPGTPNNGSKNGSVYTYNSVVSFQCDFEYSLFGSISLICLSNSSYNASLPSCLAGCGDPGVPDNGQRQGNTFSIDSVFSFTCDTGYTLSGSNSLLCLDEGSWNDTAPTCNPVNCDDPGTLTNGTSNGTVFTFNSTVLYSCDTGYTITGIDSLTCLSNGSWDESVPSCNIVNCSNPGEPTNGMLQGGTFTYNSVVTYNCSVGYNLTGATSLTCLSNGTWNESVPSCPPVNCGDPGTRMNSNKSGSVYTYSSVVSYQCISGYSISGTDTLSCLSTGSWNGSVPYCYPDCIDPGDLSNGQRTGDTFSYNSVLSYTCNTGYNLTGESSITCLSNGTWSNMIPSCIIVNCSDPGTPTNGERFGVVFTYEAEVVYSCNDKYSIVGAQAIRCQSNGYWSDALPSCVYIDCPDPGIPDNGLRTSSNFSFNSSVNFTCYPGYQLTGNDVITCSTDGKWSEDIPSCNITYCSAPMSPANGNVSYTSLSVNSSVYFTCNIGYTLTGDTNITCLPNTQWSNVIPTCTITVCPLTPPSHGYFTPNNNQYNYGTIVSVSCNPGYGLVGVSTLTCTATGQWSNNIPLCIAIASSSSTGTQSRQSTASSIMSTNTRQSMSTSIRQSSSVVSTTNSKSIISSATASVLPTTSTNDSFPAAALGAGIGAVLLLMIVLIVAILLILLFVKRSKRKSGKLDVPVTENETSVTNSMRYSGIYNSMSSSTLASTYEVPISTIKRDVPLSDYEDPISTLARQEPNKTPSSPEFNPSAVYAQLEDLDTEVEPSKYPIEEMYDAGDIANVTLPPPIFLEDDGEDGVVNSLYFIQEEPEKEKMMEAGLETDGASVLYHTLEENENEQEKQIQRSATLSHEKHELKEKSMQRSATLMSEKSGTHGPMKKKPVYFTQESGGRKQPQPPKGNSYARRNTGIYRQPGDSETEIYGQIQQSSTPMLPKSSLKLSTKIGSGQFGNVCKGQWKKPNGDTIDVAVKMLQDGASEQEKIKFLQEAAIMSQFTNANVIKLHGVVSDDEHPLIVIEYMPKGDLFGVLQKMRPDPGELIHHDTPALLLSFCQQVCLGMTYLSSKGFVHRDLAARNILVSADNICKIIDFGLSRELEDENYYVSRKGAMIPVKWTAPEALNYRKYSTASDVWSYGCLMYEIWSIGRKPYESYSNISALDKICSSERLPPPPGCPETIYSLMISCWHPVASERPNFHEIMVSLLQPNKNILTIPETALSSHPQAGSLGGTLKAGENMYPEIQNCYSDVMDTEL